MPAFTFEKIAPPPAGRNPAPPTEKKSRFVILQLLGRLVETRLKRAMRVRRTFINIRERRRSK